MIGRSISQYKVEEKLGQGGMGEVYRASDSKLRRDVALKVLPEAFATDPERMARFRREAQVLASLNHPHIAAIFGLEESEGVHALVLELVEGPTLGDRIGKGPLHPEEALPIARQIAQALEVAHEQGIVHRDLKPENIKITPEGQVKVLDFGLAKALEGDQPEPVDGQSPTMSPTISPAITGALTAANVILGTAGYMSPEQARGQAVDRRADIWAFGVCLFEMLTGRRLFVGDTVSDTLASVLKVDPEWDALPARTPAKVKRLLRRCLERDAKSRLRDIGDARIALEEVLAGSLEDDLPVDDARAVSPRQWTTVGIGTVVIAAIAFLAGSFLAKPEAEDVPVRKFVLPLPDVTGGIGSGTTVAISPDGSRIAYTSEGFLWIRDLDRLEPRRLNGTEDGIKPFWSPDGEWLAYGTTSKLWKVPATGGNPAPICDLPDRFSAAAGGVWRSDGDIIFCDGDGPLFTVSSQGGDADTLLPIDPDIDDDFHNVAGLPDDRGVVFVVHRKEGAFDRIDAFAGGVRSEVITHEGQSISRVGYSPSGHLVYHRSPLNEGIWAVPFSLDDLQTTGRPFLAIPDGDRPHVAQDGTLVHTVGAQSVNMDLMLVGSSGDGRTAIGPPQPLDSFPSISPDGRKIAVALEGEDQDLWILDVQRGTQSRLTFESGEESGPDWSPDGQRIYYHAGETISTQVVKTKSSDGTGGVVDLGPGQAPAVSPDGRFLVYNLYDTERSNWDVWYLPLGEDGLPSGDAAPFLQNDAIEFGARLSPDGRYVAYCSAETGQVEIYLKRFPGGEGKWQVTIDGGAWPRWSAEGDELFFMRGLDLHGVTVQIRPSVTLGTPRVLFSRDADSGVLPLGLPDSFDVALDGRFLLIQPSKADLEERGPRGIVVVENWFEEFRHEE